MDKHDMEENVNAREFLTMYIDGQLFGIPVLTVQDVLGEQKVTRIPLAHREVSGSLNLRGRIVTAINLRYRLELESLSEEEKKMSVVVEHKHELYSLTVDSVGEVLALSEEDFEKTPATLKPAWRQVSAGVYRLKDSLLIILDVAALLDSLCKNDDEAA